MKGAAWLGLGALVVSAVTLLTSPNWEIAVLAAGEFLVIAGAMVLIGKVLKNPMPIDLIAMVAAIIVVLVSVTTRT